MTKETIAHPAHYQGCCELTRPIALQIVSSHELDQECIQVIEKYNLGFHAGNALKYLWRAEHKGALIEDLKKARWYFDRHQTVCGGNWGTVIDLLDRLIFANNVPF